MKEDPYSSDRWFAVRAEDGTCIRATFPTEALMETPARQIAVIRDGLNRVIRSM